MSKGKKTILIIEDDPTQRMMYEIEFINFGYHVVTADSGANGIAMVKKEKPDLTFLDMMLGDMAGIEVLRKIKVDKITKNANIVVMTNLTKKGLTEEAKELGALDYLVKSKFTPREVVKIADKYLK